MNPLDSPLSPAPVYHFRHLPMVKVTWEFDFYRSLSFNPRFYGVTVSELHAGNLRRSEDGRYASLFPGDKVSYWSGDPATARAEARKYNPGLDHIMFHAYDDASSTFPTSDCCEPLVIVDGIVHGFVEILEKLDAGVELSDEDRSLISSIADEKPDCLMYESHVRKDGRNFLFFEKGFAKLSLREVRLRLEHRDEKTGRRRVNRNQIYCAGTCDYAPYPEEYGRCFLPIAKTAMVDEYLSTDEYARRGVRRWHQPYRI